MAFDELCGSNSSQHSINAGNDVTRVFAVDWANRITAAESLLGSSHPEFASCWCHTVEIEPLLQEAEPGTGGLINNPAEQVIVYARAKLTARYGTDVTVAQMWPQGVTKPAVRANTSLVLSIRSTAEFMRFPARDARWEDNPEGNPNDPIPDEESPAGRLLISQSEYELVWDYVDDPPLSRFESYKGKVNDDVFLGCPAETLLFGDYSLEPSRKASILSPTSWKMTVVLRKRSIAAGSGTYGWNHEYRGDGWERVLMFDGSNWGDRYPQDDFSALFT